MENPTCHLLHDECEFERSEAVLTQKRLLLRHSPPRSSLPPLLLWRNLVLHRRQGPTVLFRDGRWFELQRVVEPFSSELVAAKSSSAVRDAIPVCRCCCGEGCWYVGAGTDDGTCGAANELGGLAKRSGVVDFSIDQDSVAEEYGVLSRMNFLPGAGGCVLNYGRILSDS